MTNALSVKFTPDHVRRGIKIKNNHHVQWMHVERPSEKDFAWLQERFGLHPIIAEELRRPSARATVESYDDYLYFVYYFPRYDNTEETSARTEIDFIVTKDSVATVDYEALGSALDDFEVGAATSSLELMCRIIEHLIDFQDRQLRHIREKVETIGHEMFDDKEKEMLEKISRVKRDISEYRIVVRLQGPTLNSLVVHGKRFWGDKAEIYLNNLIGEHLKVVNQLEDYREAVRDFEGTNNQLMNLKINTVMKTFTSLSFLTFPFMLLAALFSMNTRDTPLIDMPGAFWIILSIMAIGMIVLVSYFKGKKWF